MDYPTVCLLLVVSTCLAIAEPPRAPSELREAYFNGSAYMRLYNPISLHSHIGISFRSCFGGELFLQQFNSYSVQLIALPDHVLLSLKSPRWWAETHLPLRSLDNKWHFVGIVYRPPELIMLDDSGHSVIIANSTYNKEALSTPEFEDENSVLVLGSTFIGCMLEGPSLIFNATNSQNVKFGTCPLSTDKCADRKDILSVSPVDHCYNEPCMGHGICLPKKNRYECRCYARYAGNNCQVDNGPPCDLGLCANNGHCEETKEGDYTCTCTPNYFGPNCKNEISSHPICTMNPCENNGTCRLQPNSDNYLCVCPPGFTGLNCETNIDDCLNVQQPPCQNDGVCLDGINNYTCICDNTGYIGSYCEINVNECDIQPGPCLNEGICFDTYGGYVCHCQPGYAGNNCQSYQNDCLSSPCMNGGTCEDMHGSYRCKCPKDTTGPRCALRRGVRCVDSECPPHSTCADHGSSESTCVCDPGYFGAPPNCTLTPTSDCHSNPCINGGTCNYDILQNTFNCTCPPGFTGIYCEQTMMGPSPRAFMQCADNPCIHSNSCEDHPTGYTCNCEPGWTGANCENDINECLSEPCQNGGECSNYANTFHCRCLAGFTGKMCEKTIDLCSSHPCQNGGSCVQSMNNTDFVCECPVGFTGVFCETNIDDCLHIKCPNYQVCYDGDNSYTCACPNGFTGENCTIPTDFCASNPCLYNGTCIEGGGGNNYTCTCLKGFTGRNCEHDKDECKQYPNICNHGICINRVGTYDCYCKPGFTGLHCDIDFDECLSMPCKNNGSCVNEINNYKCFCTPGFTGKDCSIDINECDSNPCIEGSTCIDGLATFKCICKEGLTGPSCEINIDDCESAPCLNGGVCEDGLNSYTCNCNDTGYHGPHCELNIDDCASDPCVHGATCEDGIKNYTCNCYPGYTGINCEIDIQECESSPCQYRGVCLERSNSSLYQNKTYDPLKPVDINKELNMLLPMHFYQEFSYENASGFECVCIRGITGLRCEVNINDCDSSPCGFHGRCEDLVGSYKCICAEGFEGDHCQKDIDECARYNPCVKGVCYDRMANYFCECQSGWGGKNCSVALQGCTTNSCLNGGTCHPWLFNETDHRFNCTCDTGYHGNTCKKVTTMSLGAHSYVVANTVRDEGYDIQFRFKTTLGKGLLAIGKGLTFYVLQLQNGSLNLRSSIINRWEGASIGSALNDSKWQKVFVAINTSHLVLAANAEQTIYPINLNEASNNTHTSFPKTYIGDTISFFSGLTDKPLNAFIGCVEDVIINGEWILPDDDPDTDPIENSTLMDMSNSITLSQTTSRQFHGVQMQCPRVEQCGPKNPCHSGGHCTDLWTSFHCSCQRPYFGHTCQYNVTAATFGHENITDSLVTVMVFDSTRRAVRNIVDISMFIRTRKSSGQIFYLGSKPKEGSFSEETYVAASLVNGELFIRLQFNQTPEAYTVGGNKLDNGYNHLIQVVRNATLIQVKLNESEYFRKPISATGQLDAQVLYLGGQPLLSPSRAVRQVELPLSANGISSNIPINHGNLRSDPVTIGALNVPSETDYFKGVIQDVQISNGSRTMIVEFFPLQVPESEKPPPFGMVSLDNNTILEGIVSDNSCSSNPCRHNGTCYITWNDFRCTCPHGYKGKTCQEIEFCQVQGCPIASTCRNLDDGYECIANATFDGHNTTLSYNLTTVNSTIEEESLMANSISLVYRSKTGGTLLHIENSDLDMISISVFRDQVAVAWRLPPSQVPEVRRFRKHQPDFEWTRIYIVISDNRIQGGFNDWMKEDLPAFVGEFNQEAWIELLKSGEIYLGGVRTPGSEENIIESHTSALPLSPFTTNDSYHGRSFNSQNLYSMSTQHFMDDNLRQNNGEISDMPYATENNVQDGVDFWMGSEGTVGENFKGCLGEVRIGDLLLPFFTLLELYPDFSSLQAGRYYFSLLTEQGDFAPLGCTLCFEKDCLNGGHCAEPSSKYACTCPVGFASDDCSIDIDECADGRCQNNSTCVDGIGNYTCTCQQGWEGWLCDVDIDECASQPCENGGTCTDLPGGFSCLCPDEFTGLQCSSPRLLTCAHQPCRAGSTCSNKKDLATGNNFTCSCLPGYEGIFCDIPYCKAKPCVNGAVCETSKDIPPTCKCVPGFTGKFCEINIDECKVGDKSPCLNGGRCIDGINAYTCDCHNTGYTGVNCEEDINECISDNISCGEKGTCLNTNGSYMCRCEPGKCGNNCALPDPCSEVRYRENEHSDITSDHISDIPDNNIPNGHLNHSSDDREIIGPCENNGVCQPKCNKIQDYECQCVDGWGGKNCTDPQVSVAGNEGAPVGIIVGGIVGGLCALGGIALVAACMLARSKRATRGTYSPSGQEYRNPRLEMLDSVLKPPPEERLI